MTDNWTHIVTCMTEECSAFNISLPQIINPIIMIDPNTEEEILLLDENGNEIISCICGQCGNEITNIVEVI